ncbi:Pentatricopeptide repeat-containing protein At1g26900, mitochondrial, partial [Linum perenne]
MNINKASRLTPKLEIWLNHRTLKPNSTVSPSQNLGAILKTCNQTSEIVQIHGFMVKTGLQHDPFSVSKLLASSIRDTRYAASIFESIREPNLFMFNSMLRAYCISETPGKAFSVFNDLRARSIMLDQFSFVTTLKACARELDLIIGREIHGVVVRSGHLVFVEVKNALLHLYGVCGEIDDAGKLFGEMPERNDLVSWNILMAASQPEMVMRLLRKMFRRGEGVSDATLLTVLSSFGELEDSLGGESIHGYCIKTGLSSKVNIATSLVEMYSKTGSVDSGRRVFDGIIARDVVLWNCMIDRYAKAGLIDEGIALLRKMMKDEHLK